MNAGTWRRVWLGALLLAALSPRPAAGVPVPPALRGWLEALDSAPTPAQVRRAGGDQVATLLDGVARDGKEIAFVRNRAIGLLSQLDDAASEKKLRRLLQLSAPAQRATAALAWLAGPLARHPSWVSATLPTLLADPAAGVRAAAARGLRYVADRRLARALAVAQRARESDVAVRSALDAAIVQIDAPQGKR